MIVIPMAGLSSRFARAGYADPKYMLPLQGKSVFAHSVGSFVRYFDTLPFLFVVRDIQDTAAFVRSECARMGVRRAAVISLEAPTSGQAETVALGVRQARVGADEPLTIFNIDTFRPGFDYPTRFDPFTVDGYLEVFEGSGDNWSFVRPLPGSADRAAETAEKQPISNLCCTGLYHFRSAGLFLDTYEPYSRTDEDRPLGETYVAPMYNRIIRAGGDVRFEMVPRETVVFCGVPGEYEALLAPGRGARPESPSD